MKYEREDLIEALENRIREVKFPTNDGVVAVTIEELEGWKELLEEEQDVKGKTYDPEEIKKAEAYLRWIKNRADQNMDVLALFGILEKVHEVLSTAQKHEMDGFLHHVAMEGSEQNARFLKMIRDLGVLERDE